MSGSTRLMIAIAAVISLIAFFVFVMPSLIGILMGLILLFAVFDMADRRYRFAARTFNSAVRAVCHHEGAVGKVAVAFSRRGPLRSPCYEYARRLMMGEHPVDAAAMARVPLQLSTAVALESPDLELHAKIAHQSRDFELQIRDTSAMPVYGQLMYLTTTACTTCLVLTFMAVFIVPGFEKMFEEFEMDLPHAALLKGTPALWILAFVAAVVLLVVPLLNRGHLFKMKLGRWLPMMPSLAERKAEMLCGLADAIDAGWPMGRALAVAHTIAIRRDERQSLEIAMQLINQGLPPSAAIGRAGWVSAAEESWLIDASPQRTAELLRVIADQNIRDARANLRWLMSVFFPVIVLMLGVAVLTFAYGFFGTLMELISGLS